MEWAVRNTLNAGSEVAALGQRRASGTSPFARASSAAPRADFAAPLEWKVAGPTTTEHFSAVCYYFVRELQKTVNVPQGLIYVHLGRHAHRDLDVRGGAAASSAATSSRSSC